MQNSAFNYDKNAVLLHDAPIKCSILLAESNNPTSKREGARQGMEAYTEVKYVCRDFT